MRMSFGSNPKLKLLRLKLVCLSISPRYQRDTFLSVLTSTCHLTRVTLGLLSNWWLFLLLERYILTSHCLLEALHSCSPPENFY